MYMSRVIATSKGESDKTVDCVMYYSVITFFTYKLSLEAI